MEYRSLGNSGLKVSVVGIGCNNFGRRCDEATTQAVVDAALDARINFFDTADVYGPRVLSEELLGKALKGKDRSQIVIATKFAMPMGEGKRGASRGYILSAVEASLKRLDTDYIDLYQQHAPDPETPIDETLRALIAAQRSTPELIIRPRCAPYFKRIAYELDPHSPLNRISGKVNSSIHTPAMGPTMRSCSCRF